MKCQCKNKKHHDHRGACSRNATTNIVPVTSGKITVINLCQTCRDLLLAADDGIENKKLQVTFEMTNPMELSPASIGGHIQHYIESRFDSSIDHLSVRPGLPIGARELPTGQTETLSGRLRFILDFLEDDAADGTIIIKELRELLDDVEKAEGAA